jgi:hypothetical protein
VGGAGAALRAGISNQEASNLQQFADLAGKEYANNETGYLQRFKDYVAKGHLGTHAKPFGIEIPDVMKAIRQTPSVEAIGFGWKPGDDAHYTEFEASPLRAYLRRTGETAWGAFGPTDDSKTYLPKVKDFLFDSTSDTYMGALNKAFGAKMPAEANYHNYFEALNNAITEYQETTGKDLSGEVPIGGEFDDWLKDHKGKLYDAKRSVDLQSGVFTRAQDPAGQYSNAINPILGLRKWLPWVGGGLAAGGAGWLLYRHLQQKEEEENRKLDQQELDQQDQLAARRTALPKAAAFFDGALGMLEEPGTHPAWQREAYCLGFANHMLHNLEKAK